MKNLKLKINGLNATMQPIQPKYEFIKKELEGNDYLVLYGALAIIAEHNAFHIGCAGMTMTDIIKDAFIEDNELYLNGTDGYELNDRLKLDSLFLNENNIVMMSVYDNKKDRFINFVA